MALNPYETPRGRLQRRAETTRRQFLFIMGGLAAVGSLILGGFKLIAFMQPGATGEAPLEFKTDFTTDQLTGGISGGKARNATNVVSITAERVTLVLDAAGIYAVYLVCTHLGCTPNYVTDVVSGSGVAAAVADARGDRPTPDQIPNGWACPCHGSRYFIDSTNFYGPAPRPMDWVSVAISPDNHFIVDRGNIVAYRQPGDTTPPEWRLDPASGKNNGKTLGVS
jgi:cytochrome b6-f complex iron-sulfur subunit